MEHSKDIFEAKWTEFESHLVYGILRKRNKDDPKFPEYKMNNKVGQQGGHAER